MQAIHPSARLPECPAPPSLDQLRQQLRALVLPLGFSGFWYQGIPHHARQAYRTPCRSQLFTPAALRRPVASLASSSQVQALQRLYLGRVARQDPNFEAALELASPYHYRLDAEVAPQATRLFHNHGVCEVLSWPLPCFGQSAWSGRFTLLSDRTAPLGEPPQLEQTLRLGQALLLESHRHLFNPYRHSRLFNPTAIEVLKMAASGFHNHEIADRLHITVRGVEYHMESLRKKLGAANRANLIHIAHQLELF
ncbi:helix-turn-helix transcriptional regulator [Ferrimonas sediminicola]|uniref:Helix-turn-helix transcriptional regulator n=1 Tax=Ferrimonas sediminicola TaxID=2569538 RepID=A0A4U1BCJ3_9GAMM|nr:helix-turn-helix transcriptional regulator [Ferrimonas sediminicola]TKB48707.1 helix-turn-helix transcriptional regulator [Ferrimonas sediminicola]